MRTPAPEPWPPMPAHSPEEREDWQHLYAETCGRMLNDMPPIAGSSPPRWTPEQIRGAEWMAKEALREAWRMRG